MARISQITRILVRTPCRNPVNLRWTTPAGARATYTFEFNQRVDLETTDDDRAQLPSVDVFSRRERAFPIAKLSRRTVSLTATNIDRQTADDFGSLYESTDVEMFVGDALTGVGKWVSVEIEPGSRQLYETDATLFELTFNVLMPERYIIRR